MQYKALHRTQITTYKLFRMGFTQNNIIFNNNNNKNYMYICLQLNAGPLQVCST